MYIWRALFLFRAPPLQVIQLPTLDDSFSVSAFQPLNEKRPFSKHFKGFQRLSKEKILPANRTQAVQTM
jgi:hypothetical protein